MASGAEATFTLIVIDRINTITATYGDELASINLSSNYGTWEWLSSDNLIKQSGIITINALFTANINSSYTKEFAIPFDVSKKIIELNVITNTYTYDTKEHQIVFDYKTSIVDGDVINITNNTAYSDAGEYDINLVLNDDNYELANNSKTLKLIINKANLEVRLEYSLADTNSYNVILDMDNKSNDKDNYLYYDSSLTSLIKVGYSYFIQGTDINVTPNVNIKLYKFNKEISFVNSITNYGNYKYEFVISDDNFNGDTFDAIFKVYIAELTTSTTMTKDLSNGYTSIDEAILAAQKVQDKVYIYAYGDANIGDVVTSISIPTNAELYLPHNAETKGVINYNPATGINTEALTVEDLEISNPKLYLNITVLTGVEINLYGTITIGADRGRAGTAGAGTEGDVRTGYSQITLNGNMTVFGTLWSFGYIKGSGTITVQNGASVYEPFVVKDWRGGTNAAGAYGGTSGGKDELNNVVPFNQYEMHHIEVEMIIQYGSIYTGLAAIYTGSFMNIIKAQWNTCEYPLIGRGAILELLDPMSYIIKTYDSNLDQTTFEIHGNVQDNPGALHVKAAILDLDISTQNLFFGISHNVKIVITNKSSLNVRYKYKMLPGSELIVDEGGTLNIEGKLIVYKDWEDVTYASIKYPSYKDVGNAKLEVNGIMNVFGSFAGIATASSTNGIINFINAQSLDITTHEGYGEQGSLGINFDFTTTSYQHLNAYNVDALSTTIIWGKDFSNNPLPSNLPTALEKKLYKYNGSRWEVYESSEIFNIKFEEGIGINIADIEDRTATLGSVLRLDDFNKYSTTVVYEIDGKNYMFEGWYTDSNYDDIFQTMAILESLTLYALFEEVNLDDVVKFTYEGIDGNDKREEYYLRGEYVILNVYDSNLHIYDSGNSLITTYTYNGNNYQIYGYDNSNYSLKDSYIQLNDDLSLKLDFREIKEGTDYFTVDVVKLKGAFFGIADKETIKTVKAFKGATLNLEGFEGYSCWTDYDVKFASIDTAGSQTITINKNTEVYFKQ